LSCITVDAALKIKNIMDEKLKDRDVLLVRQKDSNELKAVAGMDRYGMQIINPTQENNPDFLKIDRQGNMLENFMSNFMRQMKDPTHFQFFKIPADKVEEATKSLQAALENPETPENKRFLDMHRVEQPQAPKEHAINPKLVNWEKLERYGITREALEKSGEMDRLLDYRKTNLMPVAMKFDDETLRSDARFSLRKMDDGTFSPNIHLIRHRPELERPCFGVKFTEEDKKNLLATGNLGRVVEAEFKKGEKTPVLLSLDKQTNELVAFRKEWLKVPDTYKGIKLDEEQKRKLENGEKVEVKGMTSTKGKSFDGEVQFNADKKYFELIFNNDNGQSQKQGRQQGETEEVHIPKTLLGVALSEKQQADIKAGQTVYVSGMKDREGQDFNAYVKVNTEKNKLDFFKWNPDRAKKEGAEVKPDNAGKTQFTVNSEDKERLQYIVEKGYDAVWNMDSDIKQRDSFLEKYNLRDAYSKAWNNYIESGYADSAEGRNRSLQEAETYSNKMKATASDELRKLDSGKHISAKQDEGLKTNRKRGIKIS
jgi:hypothetical protein